MKASKFGAQNLETYQAVLLSDSVFSLYRHTSPVSTIVYKYGLLS